MVEIGLVLDPVGALCRLTLEGHAGNTSQGENLACAGISMMARSVARLLANRSGWIVDGDAPRPGDLSLEVRRRPEDTDEWLLGITEILLRALADINREYPEVLSVTIEEKHNGS